MECGKTRSGHGECVNSVLFSPAESLLVSRADDKTVKLWNVGRGECGKTLSRHGEGVYSVFFFLLQMELCLHLVQVMGR